jgi:CheY-like chemotaxis protein
MRKVLQAPARATRRDAGLWNVWWSAVASKWIARTPRGANRENRLCRWGRHPGHGIMKHEVAGEAFTGAHRSGSGLDARSPRVGAPFTRDARVELAGCCASGAEALELARCQQEKGRVDVMFLDVQMPEIDGFAVVSCEYRAWPRRHPSRDKPVDRSSVPRLCASRSNGRRARRLQSQRFWPHSTCHPNTNGVRSRTARRKSDARRLR